MRTSPRIAPRGVLSEFAASWQGDYPHVSAYRLRGNFSELAIAPRPARPARPASGDQPAQAAAAATPGVANLSGSIDAGEQGGSISLASRDAVLQLPAYLADPLLPFSQLDLQAKWALRDGKAASAATVIDSLEEAGLPDEPEDGVFIDVELDPATAMTWMRSFTDMRLAIATRLGIEDGDEEHWASLPDDDPRAQVHDIYEWLGFLQETLVRSAA